MGRGLVDKFVLSHDSQIKTWTVFQNLYREGIALNVGTDGNLSAGPFSSGKVGMIVASSAATSQILKDATSFKPIAVPFPVINKEKGGAIIGGNSLWVLGNSAKAPREQAAWKFVSFMRTTSAQELVFSEGGYLPMDKKALENMEAKSEGVQKVLLEQLASTKDSVEAAGCHSGAMKAQRNQMKVNLEAILIDGKDVSEVLRKAEQKSSSVIKSYNDRAAITERVEIKRD